MRTGQRLQRDCDGPICGASFAGLAVARELAGSRRRRARARPLRDRRAPDLRVRDPDRGSSAGLEEALQQTFEELVIHTPHASVRYDLPWTFSTFDYRTLCGPGRPGRVRVRDRQDQRPHREHRPHRPRRRPRPADRRRARLAPGARRGRQRPPPDALLSRGLEVHPFGTGEDLEVWIDRSYVPAGYGWSFPADDELRIGVGSFDPRFHVREPTGASPRTSSAEHGPLPGQLDPPRAEGCDRGRRLLRRRPAGHCLPLTAEGIRTALYFGLACGRELRAVLEAGQARDRRSPLPRVLGPPRQAVSLDAARPALIPRVPRGCSAGSLRAMEHKRLIDWAFGHYLRIAHRASSPAARRLARRPLAPTAASPIARRRTPSCRRCRCRAGRPGRRPLCLNTWTTAGRAVAAPSPKDQRRRRSARGDRGRPRERAPAAVARGANETGRARARAQPSLSSLHSSWR